MKRLAIFTFLLCFFNGVVAKSMRVCVTIADVRAKTECMPHGLSGFLFSGDIGCEETQLMYGESVDVIEQQGDWYKIVASEQEKYDKVLGGWFGYSGYVLASTLSSSNSFNPNAYVSSLWTDIFSSADKKSSKIMKVSMGAQLQVSSYSKNDEWYKVSLVSGKTGFVLKKDCLCVGNSFPFNGLSLVKKAHSFLGVPYVWGGVSPGGVDCSGLMRLVYASCGIKVPRDAHDQYLKSKEIVSGSDLKAGDFIFFARTKENPRMNHVMMYCGDGSLIESVGFGFSAAKQVHDTQFDISQIGVRKILFEEYIGLSLDKLKSGDSFELSCFSSKENKMVKEKRYIFFRSSIFPN